MKIIKIALTGGPCAGKTTILNEVLKYFEEENINYIVIRETATSLILNKIVPSMDEKITFHFQNAVLNKQLLEEKVAISYANSCMSHMDECVIICDRGSLDGRAYFSKKEYFDKLLSQNQVHEINMLDEYDLVLDLITTAICKKEMYNLNNKARKENVEQAIETDIKTSIAWMGHRNLKVINSNITLEEETDMVKSYINQLLNKEEKQDIRSFLIDEEKTDFSVYNYDNSKLIYAFYTYLNVEDEYDYIVAKRIYNNDSSYLLTIKNRESKIKKEEKVITSNDYYDYIRNYGIKEIKKVSELYFYENLQIYKLVFDSDCTTLELEENLLNEELKIPNNINVFDEISNVRYAKTYKK